MRFGIGCFVVLAMGCAGSADETDKGGDTDATDTDVVGDTDTTDTDVAGDTDVTDTDAGDTDTSDTDTSDTDAGDTDGSDTDSAPTCPDETGAAAVSGQQVVMTLIDWSANLVRLENFGNSSFSLQSGDMCRPFFYAAFPAGTSIPAQGALTVHLTAAGTNTATDVFLNSANLDITADDELVLFDVASGHANAGLESYVRWGTAAPGGRAAQAVTAGVWTTNDKVTGCASAIVLVGDADGASGWACVDAFATCEP